MPVFFYEFFLILKINASSFCIFRTYTLGASSFILGLALVARDRELVKFGKSFINGFKKVVV